MTLRKVLLYIGNESDQISTAMAYMLQNIINAITNLDSIKKEREKYEAKRAADPASRMRPFPFCVDKIGKCLLHWGSLLLSVLLIMCFASSDSFGCTVVAVVSRRCKTNAM